MIKTNAIQLTTEEIRTIWDYKDGKLWWKKRRSRIDCTKPAGCKLSKGYCQIMYKRVHYLGHRLIWLWHGKELIDGLVIDHIDGNPSNNRIENLQQISPGENTRRAEFAQNPKGGVYFHKQAKKWEVRIMRNYKSVYLGLFQTREEGVKCLENYRNEQARSDSSTSDGARGETSEALCVN